MEDYKKLVGVLVFIVSLSAVYIVFEDAGVKMRIDDDVSKFYIKDGRWLISGEERNKLYSGSKLVYRDARNVERSEEFLGMKGIITRKTPYKNGAMILDTYEFDGSLEAVEDFPVAHTIEIFNASGLIYMYEVKRLVYTGDSVWDVTSPQSFGHNMKVSFSDGYYYSSIYKYKNKDEGRLWVKYRINDDYVKLDMRLFDPPTGYLYLNGSASDRYYEHGYYANLTAQVTPAENIWLDIDAPGYGVNYTNSATGYLEYSFLTFSGLDKFNDTDSAQNHTANGSFYMTMNKYDVLDYAYVNLTGYNSTNYPKNVKIDVGDDDTDDIVLDGTLNDITVWLDEVDDVTSKNLTFTKSGGQTVYFDIYRYSTASYAKMNFTGFNYTAEQDIEDSYSCDNLSATGAYPCPNAADEDWSTWAITHIARPSIIYVNHTAESSADYYNITFKYFKADAMTISCLNYTSWTWHEMLDSAALGSGLILRNVTLPADCISGMSCAVRHYSGSSGASRFYEDKMDWASKPNNISVDVGNDLHNDYTGTTELSDSLQIDLNTTAIQAWLDDECATVPCAVPVSIYTVTTGIIQLDAVDVRSTIDNPLALNTTAMDNYLSGKSGDVPVPVNITAETWGNVGVTGLNVSYYGSKAINVTAHNDDSSYIESHTINVRYDNYTSDYPYQSDYLTFWLPYGNAKNIEPVGQTYFQNGTDIESTTSWDWNWNLSISLNQSLDSCLSLTVKNSTDNNDAGQAINTTARTLWEINKLNPFGIDWYLDATNCNRTVLGIYKFYPVFESVCSECVSIW